MHSESRWRFAVVRWLNSTTKIMCCRFREEQARDLCHVVYGPTRDSMNERLLLARPRLCGVQQLDCNVAVALAPQ